MNTYQAIKSEIKKQAKRGLDIYQIEEAVKIQFPDTAWNSKFKSIAQWSIIDSMNESGYAYCNYGKKQL